MLFRGPLQPPRKTASRDCQQGTWNPSYACRHIILSALLNQAQTHSLSAQSKYLLTPAHQELCHISPYLAGQRNFLSTDSPKYKGGKAHVPCPPPPPSLSQDAVIQLQENHTKSLCWGCFQPHHSLSITKTVPFSMAAGITSQHIAHHPSSDIRGIFSMDKDGFSKSLRRNNPSLHMKRPREKKNNIGLLNFVQTSVAV